MGIFMSHLFGMNFDMRYLLFVIFTLLSPITSYAVDPIIGQPVQGDVGSGTTDVGNPVKVGAVATNQGSAPTTVTDGSRSNLISTRQGLLYVAQGHPNIVSTEFEFTTAQTNKILVASAANTRIVVTGIDATVSNATSVNVGVRVGFSSSGSLTSPSTSGINGIVVSHPNIAPGSGVVKGDNGGIVSIGGKAEALLLTSGVPTSGALRIVIHYWVITES